MLVAAAWLTFVALGLYGVSGPLVFGHHGYHGGEFSIRARNTLRHGAFLPVNRAGWAPPRPSEYYLHHPVLTHHLLTISFTLLGEHEHAIRLAGLFACTAALVALTLLLWRRYGPWHAVMGAWAFTLLPIDIWYAPFIDPGYSSIALVLLFFYHYLAFVEEGRWRSALLSLLPLSLACGFEWSPYLVAVPVGLYSLYLGARRRGRYLAYVPLLGLALLLPLLLHFLAVFRSGHPQEMLASFQVRSQPIALRTFHRQMLDYGAAMYGPVLFAALLPWTLLQLGRLCSGRARPRDLVGLSFLFAVVVYVHLFKQAVLIHAYRMMYGSVACAIAAVDLCAAAAWLAGRARRSQVGAGVAGAALLLAMVGPARRAHWESRETGGSTFYLGHYNPDVGTVLFGQALNQATRPGDMMYVHGNTFFRAEIGFYMDRDETRPASVATAAALGPAERQRAVYVCRPAPLAPSERAELGKLMAQHPVLAVDRYVMVDLRREGGEVQVLAPQRRPALGWLARYLKGPYALPPLARDPAAEARLRKEFGLP